MYVPAHFSMTPEQIVTALSTMSVANLVTCHDSGMVATLLPFVHVPADEGFGTLVGHVARNNRQWVDERHGEALAIVGPNDHYVSPRWRTAGDAAGTVVPTWNYVAIHVYGDLVAHDDATWTRDVVTRLTAVHEQGREHPWAPEDLVPGHLDRQLRAIVGIELKVTRVEAKAKLSQNISVPDVEGVIAGLRSAGDDASAQLLTEVALPAARKRAALLADVAAGYARRTHS